MGRIGMLGCLSVGALWAASLAACEPRIEEPTRPSSPSPSQSLGSPAPASTIAASAAPLGPAKARCIHETPKEPARGNARDGGSDPACPPDPETPPKLRTGTIEFVDAPTAKTIAVDIAENERTRQRGLMYRTSMPEDHGMIFVFKERTDHTFWMHNTCIQLDMLFIDDDGTIVGIEENTPTMNDSSFHVGCPSTYVLEVNAGYSRRHGIRAGQRVRLQGI